MTKTGKCLVGGLVVAVMCVWGSVAGAQQENVTGPTVLRYSNVKWSPSRNGLVGANIRLVREDGTLRGTFTLFEGGETGRRYRLRGTISGYRVRFTVRAGRKTLRFRGEIKDGSLVGTLITIMPDGTRQESEFKARQLYG
ncbi:MAG: hypothetical protein D6723_10395 [Acidobacteria bacterium]|nr:MAG: hypothetical protein D6723_10395 [Acidobacteriota bacterium]